MSSGDAQALSAEEDVLHQLLQQLSICRRGIADCRSNLSELAPLTLEASPPLPLQQVEHPQANPKSEDPPASHVSVTLSTVSSWEKELKELREAYRELELIAEDREGRLAQLEQARASLQEQLQASERERDSLRQKHEFQVEVSQRVARHYGTLSAQSSHFNAMYAQLATYLDESRQLFENKETQIIHLQAFQAKVVEVLAQKRDLLDEKEKSLRAAERDAGALASELSSLKRRLDDLNALLDTERTLNGAKSAQLEASERECEKLSLLLKQQSTVIERDQTTLSSLSSLSSMSIRDLSVEGEEGSASKADSDNFQLRSQITLLELRLEEATIKRTDMANEHRQVANSMIQQRDEALFALTAVEKRCQDLDKENGELRHLVTKKAPLEIHKGPQGHYRGNTSSSANSSPHTPRMTPSSSSGSHFGSLPSSAASHRSRFSTTAQANRSELNDSVMDVDDASPSRRSMQGCRDPITSHTQHRTLIIDEDSRHFDLPDDVSELDPFQHRGLKCCDEPAIGMTITCSNCHDLFHVKCIEAQRSKPLTKKQKFVCVVCDPNGLLSPKSRKPRASK